LVFKSGVLSVRSIEVTAQLLGSQSVISWNTTGEQGVSVYEVEKSTDGESYRSIGTIAAKNVSLGSYSYTDASVVGTVYYRIKAVSNDGSVSYSTVVKVVSGTLSSSYTLYPNPLTGKTLHLLMGNAAVGNYRLDIYNQLGQKVFTQMISHSGGTTTHELKLDKELSNGVYRVVLSDGKGKTVKEESVEVR
jgi:hypothetical protein